MNEQKLTTEPRKPTLPNKVFYAVSVIAIIAAAMLIILGLVSAVQNNNQQTALDSQTAQTKELVEKVREQAEENKQVSQQAANYAYCNAVLLAQYTQTLTPIQIQDLNNCVLNSFPNSNVTSPNGQVQTSPTQAPSNGSASSGGSSSSSSNSSSTTTPGTSTTPTQTQNPPANNTDGSGVGIQLPCINALGLLRVACS